MKNKRRFDLKKFIKRAVIVTLILALVEVALIFFFMADKKSKGNKNVASITTSDSASITTDTSNASSTYNNATYNNPNADTNASGNIAAPVPDIAAKNITDTSKTAVVATTPTTDSAAIAKPKLIVVKKKLTPKMMSEILNDIRKEKTQSNISANCVQVRKTTESNVENAFKIAEYLKSNGFIISGRLTFPSNQKGIKINAKEGCILLTIGSL